MRIVVVGSGGREHALLWKLKQSALAPRLFALPGNPGMADCAELCSSGIGVDELVTRIREIGPDLVIVGPEQPLADGLTERAEALGIRCFGPTSGAARLESSKVFAKRLMKANGVPTAPFEIFDDFYALSDFVRENPRAEGRVLKADGLAAGKGAFVCSSDDEVLEIAHQLLVDHELGKAGSQVVLEEKLAGREASLHFLCDGTNFVALPPAQDYKRAFDSDLGPNTGGMGTYCPAPHADAKVFESAERAIVRPVLTAMAELGCPYRGVLYVGIMLTDKGAQVIEFNCRFGDPETQVMLPCMSFDLIDAVVACTDGGLAHEKFSSEPACSSVCVVLSAEGYPGSYQKHIPLHEADLNSNQILFSAGTTLSDGQWVSNGGRVLNAVGTGATVAEARANAYELAARIAVPGLRFRTDIALEAAS
ncbi:MAG: phosphoribosylamine--glycine ligase [Calditrichaeota bacterium]|nr:phosphoribosylamine--glycine ligase [Calditrichota bacterium]MCB9366553.1 phosphoribosylamine--glycine ligase [Calditrichota bacterium]MCB9391189.1 phosphoribosylamine--glycine ligase [Calditrichota bacterium]